MKIDMTLVEKMVAAGASGAVVLAYLQSQSEKAAPRKAKDKVRKRAESVRKVAENMRTPAENAATLSDTPRARMFRECKPALLTLGLSPTRAGALITQWLKLTNDDDQLVTATILKAQELAVADAPGWILATLRGKANGPGNKHSSRQSAGADFFAGLAKVAENINGDSSMAGPTDEEIPVGRVNIDG